MALPIPANEWSVVPLMLQAAMPVDAVTNTFCDPNFFFSADTIRRST